MEKILIFLIGSGASMPLFTTLSIGKNMPTFEELISSSYIEDVNRKKLYLYYFDNWISKMDSSAEKDENYRFVFDSYYKFIGMLIEILDREPLNKPRRINIFTTNYDMMFEKAFDSISEKLKGYKNIEYVPTTEQLEDNVNGNYDFFNNFLGDNGNGK